MSCYACMHSVPVSTVHPMALKWEVPLRGRGYVLSLSMEAKLADVEWMTPSHPLHIPPCSVTSHYTPGRCRAAIKRRCSPKEGAQVIIKGFLFGIPDVTQNAGGNFVYNDSSSQISLIHWSLWAHVSYKHVRRLNGRHDNNQERLHRWYIGWLRQEVGLWVVSHNFRSN